MRIHLLAPSIYWRGCLIGGVCNGSAKNCEPVDVARASFVVNSVRSLCLLFHSGDLMLKWLGSKYPIITALLFAGLSVIPNTAAIYAADFSFEDDFSSGGLGKRNDFFRWGSGTILAEDSTSTTIVQVTGPSGTPVNARRFRYIGLNEGGSGDAAHWSEQRFTLTTTKDEPRTSNGHSGTAYPEIWISYWFFWPANYAHKIKDSGNAKGPIFLWKNAYDRSTSNWTDEEVTPVAMSLQWWPTDGMRSRQSVIHSRYRTNWGHAGWNEYIAPDYVHGDPKNREARNALAGELGKWVHYVWGFKVSDYEGARNGFVKGYANGVLIMSTVHDAGGDPAKNHNGVDRGYLMGYSNTGYDETTTFYLADWKIGTSRAAVDTANQAEKPKPPQLISVE
jgi:hypothetical protein